MTTFWMSWSTGKDSAYTLYHLEKSGLKPSKLVTTINIDYDRVAMHATRASLLQKQAEALSGELEVVEIPRDCSNEIYEQKFKHIMQKAVDEGAQEMAFGDLFLEDIKSYRENLFKDSPLRPTFPIWKMETHKLAREMVDVGIEAYLTCIDPRKLPKEFAGRKFDHALLDELPEKIDPCGENGEFHTFVFNAPNFENPIDCQVGEIVERDGFVFADIDL